MRERKRFFFSLYRYQTHFDSSLFLFFFIALSLSPVRFAFFFHNYFGASSSLFAVCDRTTNKKQPTGWRKNANSAEAKIRQEKRNGFKRNKKENNKRRILYTYICIDTRIDYVKDNYSIMSLLSLFLFFEFRYTFFLCFASPILSSSITSPFLISTSKFMINSLAFLSMHNYTSDLFCI